MSLFGVTAHWGTLVQRPKGLQSGGPSEDEKRELSIKWTHRLKHMQTHTFTRSRSTFLQAVGWFIDFDEANWTEQTKLAAFWRGVISERSYREVVELLPPHPPTSTRTQISELHIKKY